MEYLRNIDILDHSVPVISTALTTSRFCRKNGMTLQQFGETIIAGDVGFCIEFFYDMIVQGSKRAKKEVPFTLDEFGDIVGFDEKALETISQIIADFTESKVKKSYPPILKKKATQKAA